MTPATHKKYRAAVDEFNEWLTAIHEDTNNMEEFDQIVYEYIHYLHESGNSFDKAKCTVYGLRLYDPRLKTQLPLTMSAIRGWGKGRVSKPHPPLSWELANAIAWQLARRPGHYRSGVGVLVAFDCLLRIGELCNIRARDIGGEGDLNIGTEYKHMLIRIRKAKTGRNQDVIVLEPAVKQLLRDLKANTKPNDFIFPHSPNAFRNAFKRAAAELGLSPRYVPHSLRHGGATRYRHIKEWSIADVMSRGRWAASKSAEHYIQSGAVMLLAKGAPTAVGLLGWRVMRFTAIYFEAAYAEFITPPARRRRCLTGGWDLHRS